jgi:protoporphyrinogen oxidase
MSKKKAIIIGAGPAGLTAAYELVDKTDITPIIYESTGTVGGISKTIDYKGNKIDIGGHRFFSKSDRVMDWWLKLFPIQGKPSKDDILLDRDIPLSTEINAPDPEEDDQVMLIRSRLSRIFFLRKFFNYPISLDIQSLKNLGLVRIVKIGLSYMKARLFKIKNEKSLEDFFINRFGKELYLVFFKDYTEKVWGTPCSQIKPEWGSQRIKGLSATKAVIHALKQIFRKDKSIGQKGTETSLIEQFMYPKFGPGQLWEKVADVIEEKGGELHLDHRVVAFENNHDRILAVTVINEKTGEEVKKTADYVFSTMPVKDLIKGMINKVPPDVYEVSKGLVYRDFITVGLLLKKLKIKNETKQRTVNNIVPDTWIYIQEREVKVGRLQIFNNWSPYMVKDSETVWIGLEYFCDEGDELWNMTDEEIAKFAIDEFSEIDIIEKENVLDHTVIRIQKTYPAYFGTYDRFEVIRKYTDGFRNLFLIGRNGMHRYNNQDHSMLTAMVAVENIINRIESKDNIWNVNAEQEYHEEK